MGFKNRYLLLACVGLLIINSCKKDPILHEIPNFLLDSVFTTSNSAIVLIERYEYNEQNQLAREERIDNQTVEYLYTWDVANKHIAKVIVNFDLGPNIFYFTKEKDFWAQDRYDRGEFMYRRVYSDRRENAVDSIWDYYENDELRFITTKKWQEGNLDEVSIYEVQQDSSLSLKYPIKRYQYTATVSPYRHFPLEWKYMGTQGLWNNNSVHMILDPFQEHSFEFNENGLPIVETITNMQGIEIGEQRYFYTILE